MTERKPIDWEAVEREYRAGQLSIREIGRQHGVTDAGIRKRANGDGWERDLSDRVRMAVRNEMVRAAVRNATPREPVTDAAIVDAAKTRGAKAIEGHLLRAERLKGLADKLTSELETYMDGGSPSVQIFVSRGDSPATIIRTLADTAERIAKIERQALSLDDDSAKDDGKGLTVVVRQF